MGGDGGERGRGRVGHEGRGDVGDATGIGDSVDGADGEEPAQVGEGQVGE